MQSVNDFIVDQNESQTNEWNNEIQASEENGGFENFINFDLSRENLIDSDENLLNRKQVSQRKKSPINRYGDPISHYIYVNYTSASVPSTFEEALNSKDVIEWMKAMDNETQCLRKNETWEVIDEPHDIKIIDVKWVYKRKSDGSYKARLVLKGLSTTRVPRKCLFTGG